MTILIIINIPLSRQDKLSKRLFLSTCVVLYLSDMNMRCPSHRFDNEEPCFFVLFICLWVVQSPCQFEFQSQEIWYRGALKRSFLSFTVRNNNNSNEKNHYPADYSDSPKEQSLDKSEINIVIMSRDTINWQS